MSEQTIGQQLVGASFNPSGDNDVDVIKTAYAAIIDKLHELKSGSPTREFIFETAVENAMTAQMWAVKAITYRN